MGTPYRAPVVRRTVRVLDLLLALAGLLAVAALVLEYGFGRPRPIARVYLHVVEGAVMGVFVLDRLVRLLLASDRRAYLRTNWVDFALMLGAGGAAAISYRYYGSILGAGAAYVLITQLYLLGALVLRGAAVNKWFVESGAHPTWLLIGSFAFLCLAGSGLLMLPAATTADHDASFYQDALFTAVSATCVTGLITRDTGSDFTVFGQAVILALIQLGGLGIMLFGTVVAMAIGGRLSVRGSTAVGQMLGTEGVGPLRRAAVFVVLTTFILELIGAALLYPMYASLTMTVPRSGAGQAVRHVFSAPQAAWNGLFHSISAFCNAGFSLHSQSLMQGVEGPWEAALRDHWQVLGAFAPLIVLGGVGFPVLQDVGRRLWALPRRVAARLCGRSAGVAPKMSLQSKVVLTSSAVLIVLGAAILLPLIPTVDPERTDDSWGDPHLGTAPRPEADFRAMDLSERIKAVTFQSITARTAGFNTIEMQELSHAGKLWMCGLMIIGGSPASTAGGMKTVTVVILVMAAYCVLRRRQDVEMFRRSLPGQLLAKAAVLAMLYLALVFVITLLLCVTTGWEGRFIDLLFEACSACGTVGLTTGVTAGLEVGSKCVLIAAMFVGRLGPLTFFAALTAGVKPAKYSYPQENLIIG